MMIENYPQIEDVSFLGGYIDDNKIWFSNTFYNGLFYFDLTDKRIQFVCRIESEKIKSRSLFSNIVKIDDKLVLVPDQAESIVIYDIRTNKLKTIKLDYKYNLYCEKYGKFNKFSCAIPYKNSVFIIGCRWPLIVILDLKTEKVKYITDCFEKNQDFLNLENILAIENYAVLNDIAYVPMFACEYIMKIDLKNNKVFWVKIENDQQGFSGIALDGDNFWLSPSGYSSIVCWNEKNGKIRKYEIDYSKYAQVDRTYRNCIVAETKILFLPDQIENLVIIDKEQDNIIEFPLKSHFIKEKSYYVNSFMTFRGKVGESIICQMEPEHQLIRIYLENGDLKIDNISYDFKHNYQEFQEYYENCANEMDYKTSDFFEELSEISLPEYLKNLPMKNIYKKEQKDGEKIYLNITNAN